MEINVLKKTEKELELEIIDEDETILNPIAHLLTEHADVEYAACIVDHPLSNKRRLFLRVTKGKPEELLKKILKQLQDEINEFGSFIEEKVKSKK